MNDEYKEAFTMICAASYFAKESQKFKLPRGAAGRISDVILWMEELKHELQEAE